MVSAVENTKADIIAKLVAHINEKLPPEQARLVTEFTKQFYGSVAYDELANDSILNLYGAILSHWELIYHRKPGECKVRIYNPHYEQHGWQSTHTVVEVAHDDMPFLIDSLRMELNKEGFNTHLMIHLGGLKLRRDENGYVTEVLPFQTPLSDSVTAEAPIYIEIDRQTDPKTLEQLANKLRAVLEDVRCAVEDWHKMRSRLRDALNEIEKAKPQLEPDEISEAKDFLRWLENDHFTFLGYREYQLVGKDDELALKLVEGSGLGVLRDESHAVKHRKLATLAPEARLQASSKQILIISKTNTKATVHRPAYTDYIGIKRFDENGNLIGEHRFIGLYTSTAYTSNPKYIPFVRRKVAVIMRNSNLSPVGHAGKALLNILETLPRDDLFQANTDELTELAIGILHLQERKRIRLFVRQDAYRRFVSCLVYVPRERFDTELGYAMQEVLRKAFNALEISFTTWFSESTLARIHYVIRINSKEPLTYDIKTIETKLVEVGRSWKDDLRQNLLDYSGEEKGIALFNRYDYAFPAGYREAFNAKIAVFDIEHIENLTTEKPLVMSFYRPLHESLQGLHFKLFRNDESIPLSDSLPIFENMGLRVIGERPYEITYKDNQKVWINDFSMVYSQEMAFDIETIKDIFEETFFRVWNNDAENDGFNRLVLAAGLSWREITIIRAYTKYLRQIEFTYSQAYIEACFAKYPTIALLLVQLFLLRFDPKYRNNAEAITNVEAKIRKEMDGIAVLDEDRILRRIHEAINATLRTNYFQKTTTGGFKNYLSIKLDPKLISDMPLPLPMYEIFVYSPRFEGVHLRSSKVARGGLRWSDRREDFRTEILGLMKAQNVKNAVIVPSGAKGGFALKAVPVDATREQIAQEGLACYQNFIRGLLDITDNLVAGKVVTPEHVVCYDDEDPYLVVAADKGTATFSDIANAISMENNFWLDDAFASGGSSGYDHKKMGITARGAWESVKRHFRDLGMDIQNQDFTVVGIGDMSGDVFGNGMLLSPHTKLIAAFDHRHIFIDPNPNPEVSFAERQRLFNLPRSSWDDYDRKLISDGGGVFARNVKAIQLSKHVQEMLDLKKDFVVPNELIKALLKAKFDLLWNGGIGTFVKSKTESNVNAGDRTNDGIRINGEELACKVVGEGGNLGFTQLGRIEYELNGGLIFTDFIDNSAGVDTSDHEVNLKILLNDMIANGDLTRKQRDQLLASMTDDVANLVLDNNYHQTQAINLASFQAFNNIDLHARYIKELAQAGFINRELEFLPDEQTLYQRKIYNKGLTRPELAILFAYSKNIIKKEILDSELPEEPYIAQVVEYAFPRTIRENYGEQLQTHRLKREIIATIISNALVNETGFTFLYQLRDETGAASPSIMRAYGITRNIFLVPKMRREIEKLDNKIPSDVQMEMMVILSRLIRRATRWFLRNPRLHLDIIKLHDYFGPSIFQLNSQIKDLLTGTGKEEFNATYEKFFAAGVPEGLAESAAGERAMIAALDIIEIAQENQFSLEEIARIYFELSDRLDLYWFREQLNNYPVANEWEGIAREACRDDLDLLQRQLVLTILKDGAALETTSEKIDFWLEKNKQSLKRWHEMLASLKTNIDSFSMFTVAVRELMDCTQTNFKTSVKLKVKKESKKSLKEGE